MTTSRKRGRPVGTAPNQTHDERLLRQAARYIFTGLSPNATAAFSKMLGQVHNRTTPDEKRAISSTLRRLQRQWQQLGAQYLEEARQQAFASRWNYEADQLEKASPELSRIIKTFAASVPGQAVLSKYGNDGMPVEPMSLGLATLWEEIVRNSAIGSLRAEALFEQSYTSWSATGLEPDEAFLRRFAELCLNQAEKLSTNANAGIAQNISDFMTPPAEDHRNER